MMGVGLSAACGFRVFVPLLVFSVGAHSGHFHPPASLQWIGTTPALIAFGVATGVEVLGYMVPGIDHLLDVLAIPTAVAAGTVLTSGMMGEMSPFLRWTVGLVAGGGAAGITSATMAAIRGGSTATTGGIANPLLALAESVMSLVAAVVAVVAPVLAIALVVLFLLSVGRMLRRFRRPDRAKASGSRRVASESSAACS
jgi:hypothetical protein